VRTDSSATARPKLNARALVSKDPDMQALAKAVDEKNDHAVATQDENGGEVVFRFNRALWKFQVRDGDTWRTV
jgi:hypothetical protein